MPTRTVGPQSKQGDEINACMLLATDALERSYLEKVHGIWIPTIQLEPSSRGASCAGRSAMGSCAM